MLYKVPGPHVGNDGITYDYILVDEGGDAPARADGWQDFADAIAPKPEPVASDDDTGPVTRAELEAMAADLSVEFSPKIGDKKLAERIQAALDARKEAQP